MAKTVTYKMGIQKMLLGYRQMGQKMAASIIKSSEKEIIGIQGDRWVEQDMNEIVLGEK